jgi:hypothetical protein
MTRELLVATALLSGLMVGCARTDLRAAPSEPVRAPGGAYIAAVNINLQSVTQAALDEAARHTGLAVSALKVVSAQSVIWPDGSLGCPQPGMLYTQALVPGYRIRIEARGDMLDYHASTRGGLGLCPAGRSLDPVPGDSRI